MSEIDPRKNAWLEHKATRECLDGLGAVPPCELDFQWGWNAHASHTAAIREKAEALVVVLDAGIVKANQFSLGVRRTDELLERLTALKAELDKEQR